MSHCLIPPTLLPLPLPLWKRILTAGKVNQGGNGLDFWVRFSREPLGSQVSLGSTRLIVISVLVKDCENLP